MHTKPLDHLAGTVCTDMSAHKDWSQNSVHSIRGITTGVKTGSKHYTRLPIMSVMGNESVAVCNDGCSGQLARSL